LICSERVSASAELVRKQARRYLEKSRVPVGLA
jgi:hypothetical protein